MTHTINNVVKAQITVAKIVEFAKNVEVGENLSSFFVTDCQRFHFLICQLKPCFNSQERLEKRPKIPTRNRNPDLIPKSLPIVRLLLHYVQGTSRYVIKVMGLILKLIKFCFLCSWLWH